MDAAATELRNRFGATDKFMTGTWTISGGSINSAGSGGSITGIIGGTTNLNELETISTTTATPAGAPPPNADNTIATTRPCTLTFRTNTTVETDTVADQEYPNGQISLTLVGEETANATITFDRSVTAVINVDSVPGSFSLNLDTFAVSYNP